jgi:hypothetical protein
MSKRRAAYDLSGSQVTTPEPVVSFFWQLTKKYRKRLGTVLDMGAGDGRFARGGTFKSYLGVEIDKARAALAQPPKNGQIIYGCVFKHDVRGYDACIGNPPYVRHHDIDTRWRERTIAQLERDLSFSIDRRCNFYIYFFCLGLIKAAEDGMVALIIPYEWVSRPSAKTLRYYIQKERWNVSVYRFQMPVFDGVLTTASISIVDKASRDARWNYYDIVPGFRVVQRFGIADSKEGVFDYEKRGKYWALRGLSPGTQKVFTLTEGERIHSGLSKRDVVPCVTSLRSFPRNLKALTKASFQKNFVTAGEKCWLIRSHKDDRSKALNAYLKSVPKKDHQTYTCQNQTPWFNFLPHPIPQILVSSGFTKFGPKVLVNSFGVRAVGSVFGVHSETRIPLRRLQNYLLQIDFEKRVVAHAKTLKKVEVKQLNSVLNTFVMEEKKNA